MNLDFLKWYFFRLFEFYILNPIGSHHWWLGTGSNPCWIFSAWSLHVWLFSRNFGFLPQSKNLLHRLISDSNSLLGVNVSVFWLCGSFWPSNVLANCPGSTTSVPGDRLQQPHNPKQEAAGLGDRWIVNPNYKPNNTYFIWTLMLLPFYFRKTNKQTNIKMEEFGRIYPIWQEEIFLRVNESLFLWCLECFRK